VSAAESFYRARLLVICKARDSKGERRRYYRDQLRRIHAVLRSVS
jgi:DNA-binding transcriptional MerR regulator